MTQDTAIIILAALAGISEALSLIPAIKANGVIQAVFNIIKALAGRK